MDDINGGNNHLKSRQARASVLSVAGASIVMLMYGIGGMAVASTTMLVSSAASMIMVATGLLMFFAVSKIHRPPDDMFNFGYGKYEPFTVVGQGLLIIATCVLGIKFAVQDIIHPEDMKNYYIPVVVSVVAGCLSMVIFWRLRKEAGETGSDLLKMASVHWKTDALLSGGLFLGFSLGLVLTLTDRTRYTHYIDPIMTILLACYLMKAPVRSMLANSKELLDGVPSGDIKGKIQKVVEEHKPRYFGVNRVRTRKAGERVFVDVRFEVRSEITASRMAELAGHFEQDIKQHFPNCDVVVLFDPRHDVQGGTL